jgi:hypothetical protein
LAQLFLQRESLLWWDGKNHPLGFAKFNARFFPLRCFIIFGVTEKAARLIVAKITAQTPRTLPVMLLRQCKQ